MEKYICHDCEKSLKDNERYMPYKAGSNIYVKCESCHKKDPVLRDFQKTEVYSRVVGYIRPVEQWNKGKRTEFDDRKEFMISSPTCC